MKAYQFKIAIKNAHPPIWRRCIVPAGITFSQLSIVLNKVMGWSGYHLSEFEFYHLMLQLREDDDLDEFLPYGEFDLLDSSRTFINHYMENQDWFTYTYDFGDDWQHRVTIEKVIENYPQNHPRVLQYKGACPMEDCGGIDGYYECIDIMKDITHPEYKERMEWAKSQLYSEEYDIDKVNEDLQKTCYVILDKGDLRKQEEIYQDMFSGKLGLLGSKSAKNSEKLLKSKRHQVDDTLKQMADMFNKMTIKGQNKTNTRNSIDINFGNDAAMNKHQMKLLTREITNEFMKINRFNVEDITLANLLNFYTKDEIKTIALNYGLKKLSALKKTELILKTVEKMLDPKILKNTFILLRDAEIEAFENAINFGAGYIPSSGDERLFQRLLDFGYVGVREDESVDVPTDVAKVYSEINTADFIEDRRYVSWLIDCFDIVKRLYGVAPVKIVIKVANRHKKLRYDETSFKKYYELIPEQQQEFVIIDELFVHKDLLLIKDNYKNLMTCQRNNKYYIPTDKEIADVAVNGYFSQDESTEALIAFINTMEDVEIEDAYYIVREIQDEICAGCDMHDIFDILSDWEIKFQSEQDANKFLPVVSNLWNNTRMLLNRGYKPNELIEQKKNQRTPFLNGKEMPTIVPGSSEAARLLMEGKEEFLKNGFSIDFDSNSTNIPVYTMKNGMNEKIETTIKKIYPNDPCPCGSGKKYKKCCGWK